MNAVELFELMIAMLFTVIALHYVAHRLRLLMDGAWFIPRRLSTLLEGESLLNDATGLVLFRFAVAAAVTGTFSKLDALGSFALLALGRRRRSRRSLGIRGETPAR